MDLISQSTYSLMSNRQLPSWSAFSRVIDPSYVWKAVSHFATNIHSVDENSLQFIIFSFQIRSYLLRSSSRLNIKTHDWFWSALFFSFFSNKWRLPLERRKTFLGWTIPISPRFSDSTSTNVSIVLIHKDSHLFDTPTIRCRESKSFGPH